jgi:hypothetical protein
VASLDSGKEALTMGRYLGGRPDCQLAFAVDRDVTPVDLSPG